MTAPTKIEHPTTGIRGVVFDVNETLSDLRPMADAFEAVGAPGSLAKTWFAGVLRDGFALSTVGDSARFVTIAEQQLRVVLHSVALRLSLDEAVESILQKLKNLSLHPDVVDGIRALTGDGLQLLTLSNGSSDLAARLCADAGVRAEFSHLLSVEDAPLWKPAAQAYRLASETSGLALGELLLVAVHPWDIHGASRAGMQTAWVNRTGEPYPTYFDAPDITLGSVRGLADAIR
jgi:2-haloacid dehalogenase